MEKKKNNYGKKDRGTHACFGIETLCLRVYACVCMCMHVRVNIQTNKSLCSVKMLN